MKKFVVTLLISAMVGTMLFGCGKETQVETPTTTTTETSGENETADTDEIVANATTIQEELEAVEATYQSKMDAIDSPTATQTEMNINAQEVYQLWDDELNSLWGRLSDELDADRKASLLDDQRQWNDQKETEIKNAGAEVEGGSMQPLVEFSTGTELTRDRCYYLAGLLAEVRGETFVLPDDVQMD